MKVMSFFILALLSLPTGALGQARKPASIAALLMADFSVKPGGAASLGKYHYGSGAKDHGFKKWRPEHGLTTEQNEKDLERWDKLLNAITRK